MIGKNFSETLKNRTDIILTKIEKGRKIAIYVYTILDILNQPEVDIDKDRKDICL